jgi:hypothetical protein
MLPLLLNLLAQLGLSALTWGLVPGRLPIHWTMHGEIDGWAPSSTVLLFTPTITAFLGLLLQISPRWDPSLFSTAAGRRAWTGMQHAIPSFFTLIHTALVLEMDLPTLMTPALGALIAALGFWMRDVPPNRILGFRLPWTLASDLAWVRTHSSVAKIWPVVGALTLLASLAGTGLALGVLMVGLIGSTIALTALSARWWSEDPERRPLWGPRPGRP